MSDYQVLDEVQANLDEIHRRYKKLQRENIVRHIAIFGLNTALVGLIYLLWLIWSLV